MFLPSTQLYVSGRSAGYKHFALPFIFPDFTPCFSNGLFPLWCLKTVLLVARFHRAHRWLHRSTSRSPDDYLSWQAEHELVLISQGGWVTLHLREVLVFDIVLVQVITCL